MADPQGADAGWIERTNQIGSVLHDALKGTKVILRAVPGDEDTSVESPPTALSDLLSGALDSTLALAHRLAENIEEIKAKF